MITFRGPADKKGKGDRMISTTLLDIINVLEQFSPEFSARVWRHAKILLIGAILYREERTVAAILRVMGLTLCILLTQVASYTFHNANIRV